MHVSTSRAALAAVAFTCVLILPTTVRAAAPPAPADACAPQRPQPFLPGFMGMVVAIDPETGMLAMPTPEQLTTLGRTATLSRAEEDMLSRSSAGLREFRLADGTVGLDLAGRFQEFSVARIGTNGRVVFDCTSDLAALLRMLASGPVPIVPAPTQPAVLEDR